MKHPISTTPGYVGGLVTGHVQPSRECTWCRGRGFYGSPGKRCEWCDGSGKVPARPVGMAADAAEVEYRSWFPVAPWHPASMDGWTLSDVLQFYKGALPAPQPWRGLTKDEIDHEVGQLVEYGTEFVAPLYAVVEGIERKLRERNAGVPGTLNDQQEQPR